MNDTVHEAAPRASHAVRPVGAGAWWTLSVLSALYVFAYLDRYVMTMLVSDMQASLGISDFQMGLVLGPAFAIFYSVFSIPFGWAADRYSKRWVIFVGALLFGLATAISGFVTSFATLLLARICVAVGEASLTPSALALIAARFPKERLTTAISIYSIGPKIGGAAAYGIGGITLLAMATLVYASPELAGVEPWRLTFLVIGIPSALIASLVFTFSETSPGARDPNVKSDRAESRSSAIAFLRSERRLLTLVLIGFSAMSICGNSLIAWLPTYAQRSFGWSPAVYGPILSAISFAGAGSLVIKGMIMDWFFRRGVRDIHARFYSWLLMTTLPLAAMVFLIPNGTVFFLLYSVIGVVTIPWVAYASVTIQVITPPSLRGRVWGTVSIPLVIAGGIGPFLVGVLNDYVFKDPQKIGWSLTVLMVTCLPLAIFCMRACLPALRSAVDRNDA